MGFLSNPVSRCVATRTSRVHLASFKALEGGDYRKVRCKRPLCCKCPLRCKRPSARVHTIFVFFSSIIIHVVVENWHEGQMGTNTAVMPTHCLCGGMGPASTALYRRIAHLLAEKRGEHYSHVMAFVRCRISFSLLKIIMYHVHPRA